MKKAIFLLLILVITFGLAGCGDYITEKQKQEYLSIAKDYESKAIDAHNKAETAWQWYLYWIGRYESQPSSTSKRQSEDYKRQSEQMSELAKEYKQKAEQYYSLINN